MPERRIPLDRLCVGVFIRLELKWYEHPFLFSSFKIKHPDQIETLRQLGLSEVLVIPEKSDQQPVPPSCTPGDAQPHQGVLHHDPQTTRLWEIKNERIRQNKQRSLRIQRCEKQYEEAFGQIRAVMQNLETGSKEAVERAGKLVGEMVDMLLSEREIVVHLMNVKEKDEGAFYHTLNVAILALLLGRECGIPSESMQNLGIGALFHDIGKQRIPKKLLYKPSPLTPAEKELIQLHPRYGEEILSRIPAFPPSAMEIIRQHHETMDGKGYPHRLAGDRISLLTRVTSIANVYDNHCNHLNVERSLTPHEALSTMYSRQPEMFDKDMLAVFIRCLGIYPPGTIVELSNGLIGLVVSINPRCQLRPSLLVYDPEVPRNEAPIYNLDEDPEATIKRSIRPFQLAPEIYAYLNPRTRVNYFIESTKGGPLQATP